MVQFYDDVAVTAAVALAESVGAIVHGPGYKAGTYLLVEANDEQINAMAADDTVAYVLPAPDWMVTEEVRLLDGPPTEGLEPAPFVLASQGWDGPGLGAADLTYYFYNGTDKIPGNQENDVIVDQMQKWSAYAAWCLRPGIFFGHILDVDRWRRWDIGSGILPQ